MVQRGGALTEDLASPLSSLCGFRPAPAPAADSFPEEEVVLLRFVVTAAAAAASAFLLQAFSGTRGVSEGGGLCLCSAGRTDLLEPFWDDVVRAPCLAVLSVVGRRVSLLWLLRGWDSPEPSFGRTGLHAGPHEGPLLVCVEEVFSLEGMSTFWVLLHPASVSTGRGSEMVFLGSLYSAFLNGRWLLESSFFDGRGYSFCCRLQVKEETPTE